MAKSTKLIHNRKAWIFLILLLTFLAGFLVARARYKPQIQETRDMVWEKDSEISSLREKILELEEKMELEGIEF